MQADRPGAPEGTPRRWRSLAAAGVAAVAAHVVLLDAVDSPMRPPVTPSAAAPVLEVRAVAAAPMATVMAMAVPLPEPPMALTSADPPAIAAPSAVAAPLRAAAAMAPAAAAPIPPPAVTAPARGPAAVAARKAAAGPQARTAAAAAPLNRVVDVAPAVVAAEAPDAEAAAAGIAGPARLAAGRELSDEPPVPVHATRLPPPATLAYRLRRGAALGVAELRWQPADGSYVLRLEARLDGRAVLTQTSQGELGPTGLAPLRFTDRRGRREEAANFQRGADKVTFSGPKAELPVWQGGQDALSWTVQLAAVIGADPALRAPGAGVALPVVGARADAAVWLFRSMGPETVDTADGPVAADRFVREPVGAYDLRVEVWLDPLRHHMPVRMLLTAGSEAGRLDFTLESMTTP